VLDSSTSTSSSSHLPLGVCFGRLGADSRSNEYFRYDGGYKDGGYGYGARVGFEH
jgi:hypothetical protein